MDMSARAAGSAERTAQVRAIKSWANNAWRAPPDTTLMVSELKCAEPGCPPLETVIVRFDQGGGATTQVKIHKPLADVTKADVERAVQARTAVHAPPEEK